MKKATARSILIIIGILFLSIIAFRVLTRPHASPAGYHYSDLAASTTPTPYPLPPRVYEHPSTLTTIIRQIFQKGDVRIDPTRMLDTGQVVAENPYFVLYAVEGYLPVEIEWWQQASSAVYESVSQRFITTLDEAVVVLFSPPQTSECPPRGVTIHEQASSIVIFADESSNRGQILATLAHELGHVFIQKKYPHLNDLALIEGLATWAAGAYWADWKGADFDASVKKYLSNGSYLPLYANYDLEAAYNTRSLDCIEDRDRLLTEMASFIDFLLKDYGKEKFNQLAETQAPENVDGQSVIYPPDYLSTYRVELNQLEFRWLTSLTRAE
ncbi:MAG: hypothetical protein PWQ55_2242 [Chloroflexota bacterium]|nr:hypothetical protein [Chloroflexota bacterium]